MTKCIYCSLFLHFFWIGCQLPPEKSSSSHFDSNCITPVSSELLCDVYIQYVGKINIKNIDAKYTVYPEVLWYIIFTVSMVSRATMKF